MTMIIHDDEGNSIDDKDDDGDDVDDNDDEGEMMMMMEVQGVGKCPARWGASATETFHLHCNSTPHNSTLHPSILEETSTDA